MDFYDTFKGISWPKVLVFAPISLEDKNEFLGKISYLPQVFRNYQRDLKKGWAIFYYPLRRRQTLCRLWWRFHSISSSGELQFSVYIQGPETVHDKLQTHYLKSWITASFRADADSVPQPADNS